MSLSQLKNLLPLPTEDLQQILDYGSTLSRQEAASHFSGILGETPQTIEFITAFNSRRTEPDLGPAADPLSASQGVPKPGRAPRKKKANIHALPARQVENREYAEQGRVYRKDGDSDYIPQRARQPAESGGLSSTPSAIQAPITAGSASNSRGNGGGGGINTPRAPPSAAGSLISDLKSKSRTTSANNSRSSSPASSKPLKTKINITGGTAMHGASSALSELDSAIRSLELSTNPTKQNNESRKCNCIATRHPLLAAAPNCLNCGKVICVKEGLGPCTFCNTPLLSSTQIQGMLTSLKAERGREKMAMDAASHRRAEVSKVPAPFSAPRTGGPTPAEHGMSAAEIKAKEHRDKLLTFQAQNAKRTTVRDEAADFETPDMGISQWSSMEERARQLKRQQKVLADLEWNARPEWEKRREVLSIDVVGGKVVRKMGYVEKPKSRMQSDDDDDGPKGPLQESSTAGNAGKGTFSQNPLLGGLIKPVYNRGVAEEDEDAKPRRKAWRRVQDDYDDESAEKLILNGGALGGLEPGLRRDGDEERAFG